MTVVLPDSPTTRSLAKEQEIVSDTVDSPTTGPPSKEQEAVSAGAVAMNCLEEEIDPKDYPALDSKQIRLKTDNNEDKSSIY
jgi:hypothetical protein